MSEPPQLRNRPPLTDVAASLRQLAADVDAGRVCGTTVVVLWDDPHDIVAGAVYGQLPDRFGLTGLLVAAQNKAASGAWQ